MHFDFVWAAAHLRAFIYGVNVSMDKEVCREFSSRIALPEFVPRNGVKIAASDAEQQSAAQQQPQPDEDAAEALISQIRAQFKASMSQIRPHDFEKDDDSNHHIDFVTACSNLRAANYEITAATRHHVKGVAGKIIPAIATTTALVSGLIALELYKILDGPLTIITKPGNLSVDVEAPEFSRYWNLDRFKNGFINLALPFFAFSSPLPAPKMALQNGHFTLWDSYRVNLSEVVDLKNFLGKLKEDFQLEVTMLSSGPSLIYSSYMAKTATPERMSMPLDQLISTISKKPIGEHVNVLVLEALCENEAGEDVEFPYISLYLKK